MRAWSELVLGVERDPPGTAPQRGFLDPRHAWHLKAILHTATQVGTKVLGIDDPLEAVIDRTPERVQKAETTIRTLAKAGAHTLGELTADQFVELVMAELFGYGPIDRVLAWPDVTEVMVNGPYVVLVERAGKITETGWKFLDDAHVERVVRRIVKPLGREANSRSPLVDARLPDGSRVNAVVAPCALDGPSITVRKFQQNKMKLADLVDRGALSPEMARFLAGIVAARLNIVVAGGTGSGKTTLINALSQFIPDGERVVTIEDAAELKLQQRNVVRLESKKATLDDPTSVTIRDCVVNALRMRPERIIVGECRSAEALDMLQAMNTGHDGSMTTVHANDPRATISRLETLAMMSGLDLPVIVIRKQIASAIQYIVQAARLRDGSRKVTHVTEVQRMEGDVVILSDIFTFVEDPAAKDESARTGKVIGRHRATGNRPNCIELLTRHGVVFPARFFHPSGAEPRTGADR
jgi:pilus assembly protein CpaF